MAEINGITLTPDYDDVRSMDVSVERDGATLCSGKLTFDADGRMDGIDLYDPDGNKFADMDGVLNDIDGALENFWDKEMGLVDVTLDPDADIKDGVIAFEGSFGIETEQKFNGDYYPGTDKIDVRFDDGNAIDLGSRDAYAAVRDTVHDTFVSDYVRNFDTISNFQLTKMLLDGPDGQIIEFEGDFKDLKGGELHFSGEGNTKTHNVSYGCGVPALENEFDGDVRAHFDKAVEKDLSQTKNKSVGKKKDDIDI